MENKKLVKTICKVPENIFENVYKEISLINWDSIKDAGRKKSSVFKTSTSIHLRMHKVPTGYPIPTTVNEWSMLLDCEDVEQNSKIYTETYKLANWVYDYVGGIKIGKIIIINLDPRGEVGLHIDPMQYFEIHSRYHVPVITNPGVVFSGGPGTDEEHMAQGYLCRLNNRLPHMLKNNSDLSRVHILFDIETPGGNAIF